jgi:predicted aldo/keto reductase-like oxidoreductase
MKAIMPVLENLDLCRLYVSRSVQCEYCGNQRSVKSVVSGASIEDHVMDLLHFEKSTQYNERQKAALAEMDDPMKRTGIQNGFLS